jgi:O-antigen/teichoic acid export membrane protein
MVPQQPPQMSLSLNTPWSSRMPPVLIKQLVSWRPGRLARSTLHAGGWNVARIGLQAGSLILMTRLFGAEGYGALAGSVALYITFAQFVGLGSGIALVKHLARSGEMHTQLSATQCVYFATSAALFIAVWPLSIKLLGGVLTPTTLACLAAAELVAAPSFLPLAYRYQAEERMLMSGAMLTLPSCARFGSVLCALMLGLSDVGAFAPLYLGWLTVITVVTLLIAWPRNGGKQPRPSLTSIVREGLPYMVSSAAVTAGGELDKTILLRYAGGIVTGQYAAAYRIMQAATLPVNSLILAASARMFRSPESNPSKFDGLLFMAILGYALIAAAALWLIAPIAHVLLGKGFFESEFYLRGLCLILVTGCLRQFVAAQLTTRDLQKSRNFIEITGLCISLCLLLLFVPIFAAWGALAALGLSDLSVITLASFQISRNNKSKHRVKGYGHKK